MVTALLQSFKQGAYIAIALYVVFIAVVTLTSMNPQINAEQAPAVVHSVESQKPVA